MKHILALKNVQAEELPTAQAGIATDSKEP